MSEGKTFTVSELAEQVGVPRTTINDWLAKYPQFVDYQTAGKRKLYTEITLNLLKRISILRTEGKSALEVEKQLGTEFALHPDPELLSKEKAVPADQAAMGTVQPEPKQDPVEQYALMAKQNSDKMLCMIGERFQQMTEKMDEMRTLNEGLCKDQNLRLKRTKTLLILLFIVLSAAVIGLLLACSYALVLKKHFADSRKDMKELQIQAEQRQTASENRAEQLQKELERVQSGLAEQRKEFQQAVESARKDSRRAAEAESALQREKFASERLKLLLEKEESVKRLERELHEKELELQMMRSSSVNALLFYPAEKKK